MIKYPEIIEKMISDGYEYIYSRKHVFVLKRKGQPYTIVNSKFTFDDFDNHMGHHHGVNNQCIAIKMCNYIADKKMPFALNSYIANGFIRCSEGAHHDKVIQYIETKKNKQKLMYYNVNKGIVHR